MNWPILIVILTQLLFTTSDLIARNYMPKQGFVLASFISGWFLIYFIIRIFATFGQLYVFTAIELGKTMALFGATSIVLSSILGFLILRENLSIGAYIGISLSVTAFLVIALVK